MNLDQLTGPLRILVPLLTTALTMYGVDSQAAGFVAGGLAFLIMGGWSIYQNRTPVMAVTVAKAPGVSVVVGPSASNEMLELARDPRISGIVARATPV